MKKPHRHSEQRKAHAVFAAAVRNGKLIKPKECSRCGKAAKVQGHHEDYAKPLHVIWLCSACHYKIPKGRRVMDTEDGFMGLHIPWELKDALRAKAQAEHRSMSKVVKMCLETAVRLDVAGDEITNHKT